MPDPEIRLTPRAQQVLALARKESDRCRHNHVGTGHLLLGLVNLGQGVATNVLRLQGLDLENTRSAVEKELAASPPAEPGCNVPYSPRVKNVLVLAGHEAQALNHSYVGTEHLLLGLLRENDGVAIRVLKNLGIDPANCRQEILRELDPNFSGDPKSADPAIPPVNPESPPPPGERQPSLGMFPPTTPMLPAQPRTESSKFTWRGLAKWLGIKSTAPKDKLTWNYSSKPPRSGPAGRSALRSFTSPYPANNFTPLAQQTLALARKEAERFHHNYVGTEHILLGLINLNKGVAVNVLLKMGLDLETVRNAVEKHVGHGPDEKPAGNIPYTPRVKKSLALAQKEAKMLGHAYIGTEHILLGMLREGDGIAARVLKSLHVDIERCRDEIIGELKAQPTPRFNPADLGAGKALGWFGGPLGEAAAAAFGLDNGRHILHNDTIQSLLHARREADWFHHDAIGTEDVLLALLTHRVDTVVYVLAQMNVTPAAVRAEVEKLITPGTASTPAANPPYAPGVVRALSLAREEATALNQPRVRLEHLLLGLVREGDGIAARVLSNLHVEYPVLRKLCASHPRT